MLGWLAGLQTAFTGSLVPAGHLLFSETSGKGELELYQSGLLCWRMEVKYSSVHPFSVLLCRNVFLPWPSFSNLRGLVQAGMLALMIDVLVLSVYCSMRFAFMNSTCSPLGAL